MQRAFGGLVSLSAPLAAIAGVAAVAAAGVIAIQAVSDVGGVVAAQAAAASAIRRAVVVGYAAAPALTLVIAFLLALPIVAGLRPVVRYVQRSSEETRRLKSNSRGEAAEPVSGDLMTPPHATSAYAFLEVVGASGTRFAILRDMLRIGREDDNDIRIPSTAVHRYHAAIYREHSDDWHIADLSGIDGNGIRVNGQRCSDARLADGDVIELGPGRLRFRAALH